MTSYELGFCKKAEEYGIDPAMLKEAGLAIPYDQIFNMLKRVHIPRKFNVKSNPLFLTSSQKRDLLKYIEKLPEPAAGKSISRSVGSRISSSEGPIKSIFKNPFDLGR